MAFAKFRDAKLAIFGGSVILGMTNNPAYPNPPVSMTDLAAASDGFRKANGDASGGGTVLTAAKNAAREKLIGLLRDEAHYVQIIARKDLPALLSSGFTATRRNMAQTPLARPAILSILNRHSTQLWLSLTSVPNARAYQAQLKNGDGAWHEAGIYPQARRLVLEGLAPGTIYEMRVRAVGGSTGYSDWSLPASKMAT